MSCIVREMFSPTYDRRRRPISPDKPPNVHTTDASSRTPINTGTRPRASPKRNALSILGTLWWTNAAFLVMATRMFYPLARCSTKGTISTKPPASRQCTLFADTTQRSTASNEQVNPSKTADIYIFSPCHRNKSLSYINIPLKVDSTCVSLCYLLPLRAGIETRMFYSVQRDEVYCKIRCPLERLQREAVSLVATLSAKLACSVLLKPFDLRPRHDFVRSDKATVDVAGNVPLRRMLCELATFNLDASSACFGGPFIQ